MLSADFILCYAGSSDCWYGDRIVVMVLCCRRALYCAMLGHQIVVMVIGLLLWYGAMFDGSSA
jgi:hypothetical protein